MISSEITPLGQLPGRVESWRLWRQRSHPIVNFEYQGGMTLEHFATHTGNANRDTDEEASERPEKSFDRDVNS